MNSQNSVISTSYIPFLEVPNENRQVMNTPSGFHCYWIQFIEWTWVPTATARRPILSLTHFCSISHVCIEITFRVNVNVPKIDIRQFLPPSIWFTERLIRGIAHFRMSFTPNQPDAKQCTVHKKGAADEHDGGGWGLGAGKKRCPISIGYFTNWYYDVFRCVRLFNKCNHIFIGIEPKNSNSMGLCRAHSPAAEHIIILFYFLCGSRALFFPAHFISYFLHYFIFRLLLWWLLLL